MESFENLKRVALNELKKLDTAYAGKDEFSETDVKKFDCLAHGLKCLLTASAMIESEEYGYEGNMSGRRSRDSMGRYADSGASYASGRSGNSYEGGGQSGHYPEGPDWHVMSGRQYGWMPPYMSGGYGYR